MKRLYILRHAKSSWAKPGVADIERPLNNRGYEQAEMLGKWFAGREIKPSAVVCSTATRTRETFDGIKTGLGDAEIQFDENLYSGDLDRYLEIIATAEADQFMILGHNPICDELTRYLASPSSPAQETLMSHHFGTANLAVFECPDQEWNELGKGSCQLVEFVRPKEIA